MAKSNNKKKNLTESDKKKAREKNKERMRKVRESIRNNPDLYEEMKKKERERYRKRVETGKIKKIDALAPRKQRSVRKMWREKTRKSRQNKKTREERENEITCDTPPASPHNENEIMRPNCHQRESGKKRSKQNRRMLKTKITELEEKVKNLQAKSNKYKVRYHRLQNATKKTTDETPRKIVKRLLKGSVVTNSVRKELVFNEVMKSQVRKNYRSTKSLAEKQQVVSSVSGDIVNKYKYSNKVTAITARLKRKTKKDTGLKKRIFKDLREKVKNFLEKDESSRLCAGKKECITRKKVKKQKRYLNDSMKNLLLKFYEEHPGLSLKYSTFCKMRPFWVVPPPLKRQTCLCTIHENMEFIVAKLKNLQIITERSGRDVVKRICCADCSENCLQRKCGLCEGKTISFNLEEFEEGDDTSYEKWVTKTEIVMIKGKEKPCKKTKKEVIKCTKKELVIVFEKSIKKYMEHINNIRHQYQQIRQLKKNLSTDEILIHMDFSQNYETKYHREVQSAHFGGSKDQLSLHTVIVYHRSRKDKDVEVLSFCTVSQNLKHDAAAICIHLDPVIAKVKEIKPELKTVNFLSDGPSTQYRNKKMFYLLGTYLAKQFLVDHLVWHYSESGHGKGAPDGIGGCLKRIADSLAAQSKDIVDCQSFIKLLGENCPGVRIMPINECYIEDLQKTLPHDLKTFEGTMRVHQIAWSKSNKNYLQARRLTCLECKAYENCKHFHIGTVSLAEYDKNDNYIPSRVRYSDVYSDDDIEDEGEHQLFKKNDYVVVKFCLKKTVKHYVGVVIGDEDGFEVKFLRKSGEKKFVFPNHDDICFVDAADIVKVLPMPIVNNRDQYTFCMTSDDYQNLS